MQVHEPRTNGDRPVTQVVGDIMGNLNSLAKKEARLAVAEHVGAVVDRAKLAGRGAGIAAGGALLSLLSLGVLLAAAAAALALVMATWLAILVVGVVGLATGGLTISFGARHLRRALSPSPVSTDAKEHA